jgi:SET domain-containing protein
MMTVPTFVAPSTIEGVGIFAAAPIRAGQAIWVFEKRLDRLLSASEVEDLSEVQRDFIGRYGYPHMTKPGTIVLEYDNGRFMNHSDRPNTDFTHPEIGYALIDIVEGEELTCNYAEFDPSYQMQPGRRFVTA